MEASAVWFSQMEVADFVSLHYATISRLIKAVGETSKVKELTGVMRTGVRFLPSFSFLVVKSAGPE